MINFRFFSLSNYSLTNQLLFINFFAAFIGLVIFLLINLYLISSDITIDKKIENTKDKLQSTTIFLENNSIARIPLFKNCRINNLINENCEFENFNDEIKLSSLELEPTSAQEYIIQNFLNTDSEIKISIYNNNMIEIINSSTLYLGNKSATDIKVIEITENIKNQQKPLEIYRNNYINFFNIFYSKLIRQKYIHDIVKKKNNIKIFKDTNKKRRLISYKFIDEEDNIIHLSSAPIIKNNKVFGIVIASLLIEEKNNSLGLTSFILFNFFILSIFVTIFLSLFYIRDLITSLQQLTKLTLIERQKINTKSDLIYPIRKDEIGILSNEIQKMSDDLKLQINQLEKFTTDVAHELKNPLTAIKSSSELLLKKNISEENKFKVLKNFNKEVDRMNRLISDISNFSKIISEIENEKFELIELNKYFENFIKIYFINSKNINLILDKADVNLDVLINKDKFTQVLINLVENSISMSEDNTSILINIDKNNQHFAQIKVYDQGKGINFDHKNKIFNRFYTDRDTDREKHSGLGLAISREILKSFNGSIELTKSDNLDFCGACFIIELPLETS